MGNALQRALFAWRFRDVNLLISGQIESTSRIMIYRDIYQRVPKIVPFLKFDGDPYLVIEPDGLKWVWDAYTTTTEYPYSQVVDLGDATQANSVTGGLTGSANYMRNSVKVVVDAYTGKMTYYANFDDPIIHAWSNAYPDLFTDWSEAPSEITSHFRYPENLFQVQATQYATYHVTDPSVFYQKQDVWQIPADPTVTSSSDVAATSSAVLRPYYVLMKTPDQQQERFQLILPFVPEGRNNMVAWMAADSDPTVEGEGSYGHTVAFRFPTGENIDGPSQVFSRINQNPQFSAQRTLLGQGGSQVLFGDFLVIPVENSFIYVQPVFVRANQASAVPELKQIVVANGDAIGLGTTLQEALSNSVSGQIPNNGGGGGGGSGRSTGGGPPAAGARALPGGGRGVEGRRPRDLPVGAPTSAGSRAAGQRPRRPAGGRGHRGIGNADAAGERQPQRVLVPLGKPGVEVGAHVGRVPSTSSRHPSRLRRRGGSTLARSTFGSAATSMRRNVGGSSAVTKRSPPWMRRPIS